MSRERAIPVVPVALALALSGCSTLFGTKDPPRGDLGCCQANDGLSVEYLGTGGWLLRWQSATVLTAPYFTNLGAAATVLGRVRSDTAIVENRLPPVRDADAILVGHAHFDHLLDVPYVARVRAPDATIYASRTAKNILAGDPALDNERVLAMNEVAGTADRSGTWVTAADGRVRIMALVAGHAPHFQGIELYRGTVDRPLSELPSRAEDWLGGQTMAYLIDFLDSGGNVAFRVHYQDAAASSPLGLIPELPPGQQAPVDVVILCPPSFSEVESYPEGIIQNARPRVALLGHWENFLKPLEASPGTVPLTDLGEFSRRLERVLPVGSVWRLPDLGEKFTIARRP